MDQRELSLAVVGIDYANDDGSNRRFELALLSPGDAVELRPEPDNPHDEYAVGVFAASGIRLGFLSAERAPWIGKKIAGGEEWSAVFQELRDTIAVVRVRFGGGAPTLPAPRPAREEEPDWGC